MREQVVEALSYDDVLLVPRRTHLQSRRDADVRTRLARNFWLNIPIVSAPTQWCTGSALAAGLARLGGLGILHRMQSVEHQREEVVAVKSLRLDRDAFPIATTDTDGYACVGAAIGASQDFIERAEALVAARVDVLVVDVAHGHADYVCVALGALRRLAPEIPLIAGNVATRAGVRDLVEAGADAVKVGVGPGGVCTTRSVTGCGVPQLTAVLACAEEGAAVDAPIIADGGIRSSGDITKALAAGASAVMIGSMFAGTDESAARSAEVDGRTVKVTRGFASLGMRTSIALDEGKSISADDVRSYVPEGIDVTYESRGPLRGVVDQCVGGLRSGLSYCGARDLAELRQAEFVRVTQAGREESAPHASALTTQVPLDYRSMLIDQIRGRRDGIHEAL